MRNKKNNKSNVKTLDILDKSFDGLHNNKQRVLCGQPVFARQFNYYVTLYHVPVFSEIYNEVSSFFVYVFSTI